MLTNEVINAVNSLDSITKQMSQLDRDRDELKTYIKSLILKEDWLCGLDYIEITGMNIVASPIGEQQDNGSYVLENCDDSLFMPDSGHGVVFWPIEGGKWLKIDYIW